MNNSVKALAVLSIVVVVLSVFSIFQAPSSLTINDIDHVSLSETNTVWAKTYGGSQDDRLFYALPINENSLMVGSTKSTGNTSMGWVLMLDNQGEILWNQTYLKGDGTELRYAVSLSDGYLLIGNQFNSNDVNGYVAKVDASGDLIWQTTFGGQQTDKLFSGAEVPDGFIVCGLSYSYGGNGEAAWAVKLDKNGEIIWNNIYICGSNCALRSAIASNGGIVAAGYLDANEGNYDFTLLKIKADGTLSWNRTYGDLESEKAYALTSASNGYIIVGDITSTASNTDAWVIKVDANGALLWDKIIGGGDFDSATYVTHASDGSYLVAGFTFSFGQGNRDFWLFNINEEGKVGFSCTYGNPAFQEAYAATKSGDKQYTLFGWTDPLNQPDLVGKATYDFYVVKIAIAEGIAGFSLLRIVCTVGIFVVLILVIAVIIRMKKITK